MFRPRLRRRRVNSPACSLDFTRHDAILPSWLTLSRADASPCATRRRTIGSVGPSRTNYVNNNSIALPGNLTVSGVTFTQVGSGAITVHGVNFTYSDFTVSGTSTAAGTWIVHSLLGGAHGANFAAVGDRFIGSVYVELRSGSLNGVGVHCRIEEMDSANAAITNASNDSAPLTDTLNAVQRLTSAKTWVNATGVRGNIGLRVGGASGLTFNFTLRVYAPQLEKGYVSTPAIRCTGAWGTTTDWPRTNHAYDSTKSTRAAVPWGHLGGSVTSVLVHTQLPDGSYGYVTEATATATGQQLRYGGTSGGTLGARYVGSAWVRYISGVGGTVSADVNDQNIVNTQLTSQWKRISNVGFHNVSPYRFFDIGLPTGTTVQVAMVMLEDDHLGTGQPSAWFDGASSVAPPFGDIETVAANVPRIDYNPDGTARGLLLQPSRANLVSRSNDRTHSDWVRNGTTLPTVVSNALPTPFGVYADLTTRAIGSTGYISQAEAAAAGTHVYWRIAKAGPAGGRMGMRIQGTYPNRGDALFDLINGTVINSGSGGTASTTATRIEHIVDGWYLCAVQTTLADAVTQFFYTPVDATWTTAGSTEGASAATTAAAVYSVHDQFESGANVNDVFAMIPTLAASLTRAAEQCTVSNLADIGWNMNGWSALFEFEIGGLVSGTFQTPFHMRSAAGQDYVEFYINSNGNVFAKLFNNSVIMSEPLVGTVTTGTVKVAMVITPTYTIISVNGGAPVTIPAALRTELFSQVNLGSRQVSAANYLRGWMRKFLSWNRILGSGELQALTA